MENKAEYTTGPVIVNTSGLDIPENTRLLLIEALEVAMAADISETRKKRFSVLHMALSARQGGLPF